MKLHNSKEVMNQKVSLSTSVINSGWQVMTVSQKSAI